MSLALCLTKNISKSERTLETSDLLLGISISSKSYYKIFFINVLSSKDFLMSYIVSSSILYVWCKS